MWLQYSRTCCRDYDFELHAPNFVDAGGIRGASIVDASDSRV